MRQTQKRSNRGERVILSWILAAALVLSNGLPAMADVIKDRVEVTDTTSAAPLGDASNVYSVTTTTETKGGAVYNSYSSLSISASFDGSSVSSDGAGVQGGAIYNKGTITSITGSNFTGNFAQSTSANAVGGAIVSENSCNIGSITGSNFVGNYAYSQAGSTSGGAILLNQCKITSIDSTNFIGNFAQGETGATAGAILVGYESEITSINNTTFRSNYAKTTSSSLKGGAIDFFVDGKIGIISNSCFDSNYIQSTEDIAFGGAVAMSYVGTISSIKGSTFTNNYAKTSSAVSAAHGGAIGCDFATIGSITGCSFEGNYVVSITGAQGGAIYNSGSIGDGTTTGITDTNFVGNFVEVTGTIGSALGGAIYISSNLLIKADTKDVTFRGNYVKAVDMTTAAGSAIYINGAKTLTLSATEGRKIIFEDDQTIEGSGTHTVAIKGNGTVEFSQLNDNTIYPKNAGIYGGTVTVGDTAKLVLSGAAQISAALTVNSSSDFLFDFAKDSRVTDHEFDTINFAATAGNGTLTLDADLAEETMDSITTKTTSTVSGNTELHVTALSLFNDAKEDKTEIPFTTDSNLKEITKYDRDGEELASHANKYIVNYDKTTGKFIFKKSGPSGTTEATGDTVNVMNFVWLETVNNLQKRLGDLRGGEESDMAWARFQRNNDDHKTSREFNVSGNLYQVGYDFALKNQVASRGYFGVSLDAFDGTQSYAIGGGDVKSMSLGAYYTKIYDSGHYFDFILRYGRLENDSTSYDATAGISGILTKLDYAMNSVTLSGEYGYRANLGKSGLYLEPQAEFIYGYLSGAQATSSTNYLADIDSTNHFVTRLGLAFGQRVKNFNYYLRGSYYHDFAGTIHVKYGGTPYQQDSAQNWWEVSIGGGWNISRVSYFYAELTKHFKDVSNSLNFNVGFRFTL